MTNLLLDALPKAEVERLMPYMSRFPLNMKEVFFEPGQEISNVVFPISGVVSIVTLLRSGTGVEMATIGSEGMVGVSVFLGDSISSNIRAIVQVPGEAFRMDARRFHEECAKPGRLRDMMQSYTQALLTQAAQEVACNRMHSSEERCARWLLMTHDRVGSDDFPITQEFLAEMLGIRRASVSVSAGILQKAGFIKQSRGHVRVLDRAGLESASCECYLVIRQEFERLLPFLTQSTNGG